MRQERTPINGDEESVGYTFPDSERGQTASLLRKGKRPKHARGVGSLSAEMVHD